MASSTDSISMAVFCDFENVALGVRDAKYEKFDIKPVLERLLLKGAIVVKKAYCDWERYKGFKATMHEANFELIEIPHVRQSGKNSADIRLVVDALDLCYTKAHVNTFVIVSGDSDFSPLVSKLRENAKQVIGVGVKQSTSDLLIANCDEFIFYDDLVRESQRKAARKDPREQQGQQKLQPEELEARRSRAIEMAVETLDALVAERGDSGKIWASVLKEAIKRRRPDFNESYFGFKAFGNLLEEAQSRGLLAVGRDEKSNTYVQHAGGLQQPAAATRSAPPAEAPAVEAPAAGAATADAAAAAGEEADAKPKRSRRRSTSTKKPPEQAEAAAPPPPSVAEPAATEPAAPEPTAEIAAAVTAEPPAADAPPRKTTRRRSSSAKSAQAAAEGATTAVAEADKKPRQRRTRTAKPAAAKES